jgi:hypothetical protein
LDEGLNVGVSFTESGEGRQSRHGVCGLVVGLQIEVVHKIPEEVACRRANPRSKWAMKTTLLFACVTSTVSPAGSRHDTPAGTRLVLVFHSISAGVTSDPSQPERPAGGARLLSIGGEVAVKLEEAISLAGECRDSRCPMVLALTETDKWGS